VYSNIKLKTNKIKETKTNKIEANNDIREREENGSIYKRERRGHSASDISLTKVGLKGDYNACCEPH